MTQRQIKFRAWHNKIEKFVDGDWINGDGVQSGVTIDFNSSFNDIFDSQIILMQYTGLKDKNGKEIYEGDIIQYDFLPEGGDQRAEVVYEGHSFSLKNGGNNYMPYEDRMEIIGNIYENPELLK